MSARSFRSVFMVASCAGAALSCYLVSLRVASERAALEEVETEIVLAQRDIRLLQTEIGTRGRLAQLERWNVKVLALSAPSADQFLEGGFQLARLARPEPQLNVDAPVVLASAPAPQPSPAPLEEGEQRGDGAGATAAPARLMHQASLKLPDRDAAPADQADGAEAEPARTRPEKAAAKPAAEPRAVSGKPSQKAGDNKTQAAAKPVTRTVRTAKIDPLAPIPSGPASTRTASKTTTSKTAKDSGTAR